MSDILLFGGSFNPIHTGHIDVCRQAQERIGFKEIILMPSALPPHKDAAGLADDAHRLEMCRLAAAPYPYMRTDDYEITQGGRSYTIDTLRYLAKRYPGDALWLLIGTDMLLTFDQWKEWRAIAALATLLVADREERLDGELRERCAALSDEGVRIRLLENEITEISSTEIRSRLAKRRDSEYLCTAVLDYIRERGLYTSEVVSINRDALREAMRARLSDARFHHTLCVEKRAIELAQIFGSDVHKAAVAGLLHDCCKEMDKSLQLRIVRESGIISDILFEEEPHLLHGYTASVCITREFGVTDADIINAVRYHTTARAGMSLLEEIVYLADLTSEDRTFPYVDELRALSERSLAEAMLYCQKFVVGRLSQQEGYLCRDTMDAYNLYCRRCRKERKNNGV